jgi:hypothetical protein
VDGWGERHCHVDVRAERFLRAALRDLGGLTAAALRPLGRACVHR